MASTATRKRSKAKPDNRGAKRGSEKIITKISQYCTKNQCSLRELFFTAGRLARGVRDKDIQNVLGDYELALNSDRMVDPPLWLRSHVNAHRKDTRREERLEAIAANARVSRIQLQRENLKGVPRPRQDYGKQEGSPTSLPFVPGKKSDLPDGFGHPLRHGA